MADGTQTTTTTDEAKAAYSAALKAKASPAEMARLAIAVARSTDRLAVRSHWTALAERHAAYVVPVAPPPVADDVMRRLAASEETREALAAEVERLRRLLVVAVEDNERNGRALAAAREATSTAIPKTEERDRSSGLARTVVPGMRRGNGDPATGRVTVRALKVLAAAMSDDETRYNLMGVCVGGGEVGGRRVVVMVATDGHRLHAVVMPDGGDNGPAWCGGPVIVPSAAVKAALRFRARVPAAQWCGETMVAVSESMAEGTITVSPDEVGRTGAFTTERIDATFPDYTQVVPRGEVDPVAVSLSGRYASEAFLAGMAWHGDKRGSVAVLGSTDHLSPCVLQSHSVDCGDFVAVIMPMRK